MKLQFYQANKDHLVCICGLPFNTAFGMIVVSVLPFCLVLKVGVFPRKVDLAPQWATKSGKSKSARFRVERGSSMAEKGMALATVL